MDDTCESERREEEMRKIHIELLRKNIIISALLCVLSLVSVMWFISPLSFISNDCFCNVLVFGTNHYFLFIHFDAFCLISICFCRVFSLLLPKGELLPIHFDVNLNPTNYLSKHIVFVGFILVECMIIFHILTWVPLSLSLACQWKYYCKNNKN